MKSSSLAGRALLLVALPAMLLASSPGACPKNGSLGISVRRIEAAIAAQLGLQPRQGVLVSAVVPGGAGAKAGLKKYDVITHLNGKPVQQSGFQSAISRLKPGTVVKLRVVRRMKARNLSATIEKRGKRKPKPRPVIARDSRRRLPSGCMSPPDAFSSQIARVRSLERKSGSRMRRLKSDLRSLDRQRQSCDRELASLERDLARERADLERRLARLEEKAARRKQALEKKLSGLSGQGKDLKQALENASSEQKTLVRKRKEMEIKRAAAEQQKKRPRKRREIL